jgi:cell volume regulation protein A
MTDVTGTLLTVVFLSLIAGGALFSSVSDGYGLLFTSETGMILFKQIGFGIALGVTGYVLLEGLSRYTRKHGKDFETNAAYFLFVPIIIFTLALSLGGSGYLAAFIAGLLFVLHENLHVTERFFNQMIDGFFKPTIFLLLGALVDLEQLVEYAPIGIAAALLFMFVIRPIAVFLSLVPFRMLGKKRVGWREMLFISFVRETGAIPAVLLVTIAGLALPGLEALVPIGMWVILATLILEPPLTPWVAERLRVATVTREQKKLVEVLVLRHKPALKPH